LGCRLFQRIGFSSNRILPKKEYDFRRARSTKAKSKQKVDPLSLFSRSPLASAASVGRRVERTSIQEGKRRVSGNDVNQRGTTTRRDETRVNDLDEARKDSPTGKETKRITFLTMYGKGLDQH